ncbi:sugar permease [Paenibacillus pectinilyticus]|uniref:Sugar permease n=1 Tax=Paenibacillus pectinilyticus TaxID=512399 RepID=A0A1C0ZWR4_9BACL|nr:carbohydrate ABC transporter permease [Paenibacillus pectinilyticus]OCT12551.1 sugar permease [Paenibacillus pectinilyticus]
MKSVGNRYTSLLFHVLLLGFGAVWVYPFIWMVFSSLKTNLEFGNAGLKLLPDKVQWENYSRAWNQVHFSQYFLNSVIVTVSTVVIVVVLCSLMGYAIGRVAFPGRKLLLGVITATMFIPKGYTILPIFYIIKGLGLLNSRYGVILAEASGAHVVFILLFASYFSSLPKDMEESVQIDGGGFIRTFVQVMLPLSKPIIATTAIMQFIWTWNSYFVPLVFTLSKPELRTLAVGMTSFVAENSVDWTGMTAAATISIIPIMLVFIMFQRFFIEGISGSIKG